MTKYNKTYQTELTGWVGDCREDHGALAKTYGHAGGCAIETMYA